MIAKIDNTKLTKFRNPIIIESFAMKIDVDNSLYNDVLQILQKKISHNFEVSSTPSGQFQIKIFIGALGVVMDKCLLTEKKIWFNTIRVYPKFNGFDVWLLEHRLGGGLGTSFESVFERIINTYIFNYNV